MGCIPQLHPCICCYCYFFHCIEKTKTKTKQNKTKNFTITSQLFSICSQSVEVLIIKSNKRFCIVCCTFQYHYYTTKKPHDCGSGVAYLQLFCILQPIYSRADWNQIKRKCQCTFCQWLCKMRPYHLS